MALLTLYYFPIPGRAETARLLLTMGKIEFTDKRIDWPEWPEWKPKMPFGAMPVLEVDGKMIAQMAAIDRYCASLAGLLPSDPLKLAEAEQAYFFLEDLWQPVTPALAMINNPSATDDEKSQAFKDLLADGSTFRTRLSQLEALLAKREGKYLAGDKTCHADLAVFAVLSSLQSGWIQGIPTDLLMRYPACREYRNTIASLPEIAAYYNTQQDEVRQTGFRADAD